MLNTKNLSYKRIAQLLVAIMSAMFIVSIAEIALESSHDCTGEDCPICASIETCTHNLKLLGSGKTESTSSIIIAVIVFASLISQKPIAAIMPSLITKKTRLDN